MAPGIMEPGEAFTAVAEAALSSEEEPKIPPKNVDTGPLFVFAVLAIVIRTAGPQSADGGVLPDGIDVLH